MKTGIRESLCVCKILCAEPIEPKFAVSTIAQIVLSIVIGAPGSFLQFDLPPFYCFSFLFLECAIDRVYLGIFEPFGNSSFAYRFYFYKGM